MRRPPEPEPTEVEYVTVEPQDVLDRHPRLERATTQFERSFGPSCLLSLIIVLLFLVLLKRYLQVSWTALGCMAFLIWFGVLTLLVRWRPDRVVDSDD